MEAAIPVARAIMNVRLFTILDFCGLGWSCRSGFYGVLLRRTLKIVIGLRQVDFKFQARQAAQSRVEALGL
jgi:hypothetical protein